ncbi:hypothetical protein [Salinibacterium sp. SWN248]|uniref:hypothetical protein n=1 Tax=Salinibacterium sp. SWN248 TaxID=2792056 RepID=UPI0018CE7EAD|nr:hypothetical protein [Salinibacterium sp. SWN248]MBH0022778.1 hypothetical protein [Salinibacterium sp. SWN248]
MSDELIISGGGSVSVSTEEMLVAVGALQRTAEMTRDIAGAIQMVDARLTISQLETLGIPTAAARAEDDLDFAFSDLQRVAHRAEHLSNLVRFAADSYGLAEAFAEGVSRKIMADAAAWLGFLFPTHAAVLALSVTAVPILLGVTAAALVTGRNPAEVFVSEKFTAELNELISDPAYVLAVRFGVMNADEFLAGAAGLPPSLVSVLSAAGVLGLPTAAGAIQRLGGVAGVLKETPVQLVSKSDTTRVEPAHSVEERADRIAQPTPDLPFQIRIEKTSFPGEDDSFEVYVSGTVDFAFSDSEQPFDGTSNLSLAADHEAAAYSAVVAAMAEAGITAESAVALTGHSQGAAIAARLAESEDYNVTGLVGFGGNTGQITIPPTVPTLLFEHSDDIVPAAGGIQGNQHAVIVEREVFAGRPLPDGVMAPAHQLDEYRETARLLDGTDSEFLRDAVSNLTPTVHKDAVTTVTSYEYERVQP